MSKLFVSLCLWAGSLGSVHAQEIKPPAQLVTPGRLTYAVAGTFAPFAFMKDGTLTGFDIDMGAEIAKRMGLAVQPLSIEFKGVIPALQGGRVDFINAAMYMNEARAKEVDFIPYLRIGTEVVVAKENVKKITGRDDSLCGKRVAVTLGGIQETYARGDDARCRAAGKDGVIVMTFPTAQDSLLTVRQGRADALFDSTPGAIKAMSELPDVYVRVGSTFEANTRLGYAVRKGDQAMRQAVEDALKAGVQDGTYKRLVVKWGFPATMSIFE
ncbi:ABC transporter substrate-binding protein [Variovorax sp. LjRoot175]|uniref:ABC transporter substrate-binding protein n=1 Tax=Variovorax sp. LjRoot175 TaxID=3342276 RepID=UPI003ECCA1D9